MAVSMGKLSTLHEEENPAKGSVSKPLSLVSTKGTNHDYDAWAGTQQSPSSQDVDDEDTGLLSLVAREIQVPFG